MHSSLIGKVQKARQYAQEPERVRFDSFRVAFQGENDNHVVSYEQGKWTCTCHFFAGWGICCHTMTLEHLLGVMVPMKQHFPEYAQDVFGATPAPPASVH